MLLQSLLDTNRGGPYVLGGDLPDNDARSHSSEHTGSFKGGAVPLHAARSMGGEATVDTLNKQRSVAEYPIFRRPSQCFTELSLFRS